LPLAMIDILLVWFTILWSIISIWPTSKLVVILQLPYLLWVTIATYLQSFITLNNSS
jgi:tryptophan-rich sensory protein